VLRRLKRQEKEAGSKSARACLFQAKRGITIAELKCRIAELRACPKEDTSWVVVNGIVTDIDDEVICLKHAVGKDVSCRGRVRDGECARCHNKTPGVLAYSFSMIVKDPNSQVSLVLRGSQSAGEGLFALSATEFNALTPAQQGDAREQAERMYYTFKVSLDCTSDDDVNVVSCLFNRIHDKVYMDDEDDDE
jgi:hypothetical protein